MEEIFDHVALPGWNQSFIFNIPVDVSNCQMVWVHVHVPSHDDWTLLVVLVWLSAHNWVLYLRSVSDSSWHSLSIACSSQVGFSTHERFARSTHLYFRVLLSVCPARIVRTFSWLQVLKQIMSLGQRNSLESWVSVPVLLNHFPFVLGQPVAVFCVGWAFPFKCWHFSQIY